MPLPNEFVLEAGLPQIRFLVAGSFSPVDDATNWSQGVPTDVLLTLAGVLNGAGRQSSKANLGDDRPAAHALFGCVDYTGEAPTVGLIVEYYWLPSTSSTDADANVAGNSGLDADAPGGALGTPTLAEFIALGGIRIGVLRVHDGAVVQNGFVGILFSPSQFGQLLVVNEGGDAFENDDVEMHQVLAPITQKAIQG